MLIKHLDRKVPEAQERGFSLLELMVTITIVTMITAIVMIRYSAFDSSVLLNNQAFEIALDIRETQVRSISVQADDSGSGDVFSSNFGLYFDRDTGDEYIFFRDNLTSALGNDGRYDAGEEIGEPYELDARFTISDVYVNSNASNDVNNASIVFQRPNFDARFGFSSPPGGGVASVHITVASKRNPSATRSVTVYNSGLITVD